MEKRFGKSISSRTYPLLIGWFFGCLIGWLIPTTAVFACLPNGATPRLITIMPRGVQRGQECVLRFSGERLSDTQEVFLYSDSVHVLEIKQIDDQNIEVKVQIDSQCRVGEHLAQIRTSRGISDFRSFYVGHLPHIIEQEPNNNAADSQSIPINHSILGVIKNEDVDTYRLSCKAGQRINIEIEAIRLGYPLDPVVSISNEQNFLLASSDDSSFAAQDGVISLMIPVDGDYFVSVSEASYRGDDNSNYRLHIGDFPRPTVAYPAGGPAEEDLSITFLGDAAGLIQQSIRISQSQAKRGGVDVFAGQKMTPSPVAFRVSDLANVMEAEPNNNRQLVERTNAAPCSFNGIIATENDYDHFRFSASKGEVYEIDCFARRVGSELDPVMVIFDAAGKRLAGDDDARRPDCFLRFSVPANGDYFLRISDHLRRGDPTFVYRVEVNKATPRLSVTIPRVDRYSQLRQKISVPQGNRFATMFLANRENFAGPLKLTQTDQWPQDIEISSSTMAANMTLLPVVFSAAADAELGGKLVDMAMRSADPKKDVEGSFTVVADFVLGNPNNAVYYTATADKLPCAVTKPVPFKIDIVPPKVPIVRGGSSQLKIVATRKEGFDQAINVQFPFRPPGLGTRPQIQIKAGQTEAYYPLNANANARLGKWQVYAIAQSQVEGPVWVSSELTELEIAQPFVAVTANRAVCQRGDSIDLFCKLQQLRPFQGQAVAELVGLPPHVTTEKLNFTSETKELNFVIKTNDQSPVGKHKGILCRVTVLQNNDPIVASAGRMELQIRAKPKIAQQPATQAKQSPNSPAKAKSRLQQLRERRKAAAGNK